MRFVAVVVLAATLFSSTAEAAFKGCYERVYDTSYLRHHKTQLITKLRFQIGVGQGGDGAFELQDRIDAVFRDASVYRGSLIACKELSDELACDIEGNGGSFLVTDRGENSLRITNRGRMQFGSGGSKLTLPAKGDNVEFRLFRVSESACP